MERTLKKEKLQSLKMLMLIEEHCNYGNEFHFVGPVKKERKKAARCPEGFVFVKGLRKVFVSEMELERVVKGQKLCELTEKV